MTTLSSPHVTLRPLTLDDAPALFAVTPPDTFKYFLAEPSPWDAGAFRAWMQKALFGPRQHAFAVIDPAGKIVGSTSFLDLDEPNRCVEVGATWYAPAVRGTRLNPACKRLMFGHAFDQLFGEGLGCVRVTLKCDARNLHSQAAIAKLGAVREGTLRKHRVRADGFVRDSVYFSILAEEWPAVRAGLERRLA